MSKKDVSIIRLYSTVGLSFFNYNENNNTKFNYKGGIQGLLTNGSGLFYYGYGLEIGYTFLSGINNNNKEINSNYISTLVIGEYGLAFLKFQIGLGPYFGIDNKDINLSFMFALGASITLDDNLLLPIFLRGDFVFLNEFVYSSINIFTGITFII